MRYLSVCSGIEAATQAWHPLGWTPVAFSEIEPFPCAVLAHHYPDVPNWGDMTKFEEWPDADVDVLCGGTPCQSFSIAGLRKGLADPRGNLALTYLAIADRYRPRWLVWENVPGVLSSLSHDAPDQSPPAIDLDGDDGPEDGTEVVVTDEYDADESHALACFLAGLQELGYGFAYRIIDAQFAQSRSLPRAVPQRRQRIVVVGYLGDWRRAAAVLFDGESLSGNPPPRREAREIDPTIPARSLGGGGLGTDFDCDGGLIAFGGNNTSGPIEVATACQTHGGPHGRLDFGSETFIARAPAIAIQERAVSENPDNGPQGAGFRQDGAAYTLEARNKIQAIAFDCKGTQVQYDETGCAPPLRSMGHYDSHQNAGGHAAVAFAENSRAEIRLCGGDGAVSSQLTAGGGKPGQGQPTIATQWAVRRLTPKECSRLQGFPDDFARIPYRGRSAEECPDGPQYKAYGNSMARNFMEWIGERIQLVEALS